MKFNHISIRTGSEGPRHDPYHYQELTVNGRAGKVTLHTGLACWLAVNGMVHGGEEEKLAQTFERLTGVMPWVAERVCHELPHRRHSANCNCRDTRSVAGYPGETFEICVKCGEVIDSHFNRSAVE